MCKVMVLGEVIVRMGCLSLGVLSFCPLLKARLIIGILGIMLRFLDFVTLLLISPTNA